MSDEGTRRILEGPLVREIARFGTPLAIGMALQTTFNLVDAWLVSKLPAAPEAGHALSEAERAIGALGICDQVAAVGTIISYGISTATSTLLSQQKGAGKLSSVQRTAWQSILIIGLLSLIVGIAGGFFSGFLIEDLIGVKGEVAEDAVPYTRVIVGGSFSIFFLLQLTSIQRALGSAKTPVIFLVAGNVLNVFFAILFIFGDSPDMPPLFGWMSGIAKVLHIPKMGLMGAAWATVLARALVLIPILGILGKRFKIVRPPKGDRGPHWADIKRILDLAWPTSAQFVLRIGAMILVQSLIARAYTTADDQTATVAYGLVFRLDTMALFVSMGWGSAAQTFVGQNLGAQKESRANASGWITAAYSMATSVLLLILIMTSGRAILEIFVNTEKTPDTRPIDIALAYLGAVAPSYIALGIGVVLGNAMAGAGATRTTMLCDVAVILAFQFPVSVVAVAFYQIEMQNLFRLVAATNYLSAIVYAGVYARGRWRQNLAPPSVRSTPTPGTA